MMIFKEIFFSNKHNPNVSQWHRLLREKNDKAINSTFEISLLGPTKVNYTAFRKRQG